VNRVLVNGVAGGTIDPSDRGLLYGDGLFETIAVTSGRPRFLDWHLERMERGARALGFPPPDRPLLRSEVEGVATPAKSVVKLVLTRGCGERGYRPPTQPRPTRIVMSMPWPTGTERTAVAGLRLGWCRTRLSRNVALAGIKHLNRLEQVLARAEWDDEAMDEGLMQDDRGHVISATQANLFLRIDGAWVTPKLDECGVEGIMRRAFREWSAARGEPVAELRLAVDEVRAARSLALTNALIGARPVVSLGGRPLAIDPAIDEFNAWLERA
jgi:4-amino-4-deoxychorismate lyase